jgi:hypothetical protein
VKILDFGLANAFASRMRIQQTMSSERDFSQAECVRARSRLAAIV